MSLTEIFIRFATVLFVMSLISERVANFLKLYFQNKDIYIPVIPHRESDNWVFYLVARLRILAQRQITEAAEKEREYRILVINIIVGVLSAAFINLSIFRIFEYIRNQTGELQIGWHLAQLNRWEIYVGAIYLFLFFWSSSLILFSKLQETPKLQNQWAIYSPFYFWLVLTIIFIIGNLAGIEKMGSILLCFTGYIGVGIFLSLGSKFWHDLLDILFSFKRTQETLSDRKLITDFANADQIIKYSEISQYEIAEKLYEMYRPALWKIEGILSCGLTTFFNERLGLFQKRIEVEFTTVEAQNQLLKLKEEGSVEINYNSFLLANYLVIKFTKNLVALPGTGIDEDPKCYAWNKANKEIKGTFNVKKSGEKYIAFSCLHVFAADSDFKQFQQDEKATLSSNLLNVKFYINGVILSANINPESILFGNQGGGYYGADYCECEVDEFFYDTYKAFISPYHLEEIKEAKMRLFGATSKFLQYKEAPLSIVTCNVDYGGGFRKELELYRIESNGSNVNPGDSGATVYYMEPGSLKICMGMIIAKSDNNAYMSKLWTLNIPNSCKN